MAVLVVGETGKRIRLSSGGFDMSAQTSLQMLFTRPDATTSTVTATLGTTSETFDGIGTVNANEWAYYDIADTTLLTISGTYTARLLFGNTTPTPDQNFKGIFASFTVID